MVYRLKYLQCIKYTTLIRNNITRRQFFDERNYKPLVYLQTEDNTMFLADILFAAIILSFRASGQSRYCLPCTSCWPSDDVIQSFNQSLTGFVIQPKEVDKFQKASLVFNHLLYQYPGLIVHPFTIGKARFPYYLFV